MEQQVLKFNINVIINLRLVDLLLTDVTRTVHLGIPNDDEV
jgi:hypothetical protein